MEDRPVATTPSCDNWHCLRSAECGEVAEAFVVVVVVAAAGVYAAPWRAEVKAADRHMKCDPRARSMHKLPVKRLQQQPLPPRSQREMHLAVQVALKPMPIDVVAVVEVVLLLLPKVPHHSERTVFVTDLRVSGTYWQRSSARHCDRADAAFHSDLKCLRNNHTEPAAVSVTAAAPATDDNIRMMMVVENGTSDERHGKREREVKSDLRKIWKVFCTNAVDIFRRKRCLCLRSRWQR